MVLCGAARKVEAEVLTTFPMFNAICMQNHRIIIGNVVEGSVLWFWTSLLAPPY